MKDTSSTASDQVFHRPDACPRVHPFPCSDISESLDTSKQSQSILLARLPIEIRQITYQHVVSIGVLHVLPFSGRLAFVACDETIQRGESALLHDCWRVSIHEELLNRYGRRGSAVEHRGPLNLLETCHQIFNEATEIFYAENTFDFRYLETLISWRVHVPE